MTEDLSHRVLVTGAAGFVGYHVSKTLLEQGHTVLGLDNLNDYYDVSLKRARVANISGHERFVFQVADIADENVVFAAFASFRPHIVVHLAAQAGVRYSLQQPRAYIRSNVDGFLSILEACRAHPVDHLIYASSSSVYGANRKMPFAETDPVEHPTSLYAATKRANELMADCYAHLFKIPSSGLRFFTVYGPWGRPDMAYFSFTKAIIEGQPIDVYNQGEMRRDFTYIDDVTGAIARLLDVPPQSASKNTESSNPLHRLYNIGNHSPVELGAFIAVIENAVGRQAIRRLVENQLGDVPATFANVDRLTTAVDFAPDTPLEVGIGRFVSWYRDYYKV